MKINIISTSHVCDSSLLRVSWCLWCSLSCLFQYMCTRLPFANHSPIKNSVWLWLTASGGNLIEQKNMFFEKRIRHETRCPIFDVRFDVGFLFGQKFGWLSLGLGHSSFKFLSFVLLKFLIACFLKEKCGLQTFWKWRVFVFPSFLFSTIFLVSFCRFGGKRICGQTYDQDTSLHPYTYKRLPIVHPLTSWH